MPVIGNHEYLHGNVDEWFVFLKKIKIIPLHNKNEKILVGNSRICIAGADDLFAEQSRLLLTFSEFRFYFLSAAPPH